MGQYYNRMQKYLGKRTTLTAGNVRRLNKEKIKRKKFATKSFDIVVDGIICLNRKNQLYEAWKS